MRQCSKDAFHDLKSDFRIVRAAASTIAGMTLLITPRLRPAGDVAHDDRVKARWAEFGHSWWAFIRVDDGELIGSGCIQHLGRDPAGPLETGWRLRQDAWGQGYASEAARHMVGWAFATLQPERVCAVCQPENLPSSTVMERLGMSFTGLGRWYDKECRRYDITAAQWASSAAKKRYDAEA